MKQVSYILIFIMSISCKQQEIPTPTFRTLVTDTAISHKKWNEIDLTKSRCATFNLPFIHKGVDSFEVRVWTTPSMWQPGYFSVLRYNPSSLYNQTPKWIATEYEYYRGVDSMKVSKIDINDSIAKSIQLYLTDESILNMPSQDAIANFEDNTADGESYTIEIASKNFYKAIRYSNPKMNAESKKEQNHIKMTKILDFLSKNLKVVYFPF